jgi:hypothetical protein
VAYGPTLQQMDAEMTVELRAVCEAFTGDARQDVAIRLRHRTADPLAVQLLFTDGFDGRELVFALELLTRGRQAVTGQGAVRIWPESTMSGDPVVVVSLRSGAETLHIGILGHIVDEFLTECGKHSPPARVAQLVETQLDQLLGP